MIELLASDLQSHRFPAGTVAVREGEVGELFYLIVGGSAAVSVQTIKGSVRAPTPAYRSGQVHHHAVMGCEDADGCCRVLRHEGVDLGIGTPWVVVE